MTTLDPAFVEQVNSMQWWKLRPEPYGQMYVPGWNAYRWLKYVAQVCVEEIERGNGRVIVNVPWAYGKTLFLGKILPAWFLDRYRSRRVLTASASNGLATESGRKTREILTDAGVKLREDQQAKGAWMTAEGGGMKATSIGQRLMGFHFDLALIDDLYGTWEDAQSPLYRSKVVDWFLNTLYNRALPNATIIMLMTRFHAEDLTGYLRDNHPDPWRILRLPCYAEEGDPLGRKVGEVLCPEMWSREQMEMKRLGGSEEGWEAMGQQAPRETSGSNAYRRFSDANLDGSLVLDPNLPLQIAWDFNTNPGCVCEVGQYDQEADLFTTVHEVFVPYGDVIETMDALRKTIEDLGGFRWPRVEIFGDASGQRKDAGHSTKHYDTIEEKAKSFGWRTMRRVPLAQPRVADRVVCANDALFSIRQRRHWLIHPRCRRLVRDLKTQKTDPKDGNPDKSKQDIGHAADADTYRVHYLRPMVKEKKEKTARWSMV